MLVGIVRPVETHTVVLKGEDLAEVRAQLTAQAPAGWDLVSGMATLEKARSMRSVEVKFQRGDDAREIEAETWRHCKPVEPRASAAPSGTWA